MKKIISLINQKGGCAKTTTTMALADGLALKGERVLVIDLDSQMNLSMAYGDFHLGKTSIYDVLVNNTNINDAIQIIPQEYFGNLNVKGKVGIIPANSYSNFLRRELEGMFHKEERLLRAIQKLNRDDWDYILIDSAPLPILDVIITNIMVASDGIIIPSNCECFSSVGLELITPRIQQIREDGINTELKIYGILCTRVESRRKIDNNEIVNEMIKYGNGHGIKIYKSYIRNLGDVPKNQKKRCSLLIDKEFTKVTKNKEGEITKEYKAKKKTEIAKDYLEFVEEFLEGEK